MYNIIEYIIPTTTKYFSILRMHYPIIVVARGTLHNWLKVVKIKIVKLLLSLHEHQSTSDRYFNSTLPLMLAMFKYFRFTCKGQNKHIYWYIDFTFVFRGKSTHILFLKIRLEWCGCAKSNCISLKIMCKKIDKKVQNF